LKTKDTLAEAVSRFGASLKPKLSGVGASGAPEDQLRPPLVSLIEDVGGILGFKKGDIQPIGESTLASLKTRPDYAVTVQNALIGFIEIKAPGKGADPRKFKDEHDRKQWDKLKSLPNLMYTDGNAFSLWRNGKLDGDIVHLKGDVETSGVRSGQSSERLSGLLDEGGEVFNIPPCPFSAVFQTEGRLWAHPQLRCRSFSCCTE